VTDLRRKGEGLGVPGMRCDGMDVVDTHRVLSWAVERVRTERRPVLVEAVTYRFRGHSMADPEQYRTKEEVEQWRARDPIPAFAQRLESEGALTSEQREAIEAEATRRVDEAVAFAEASPNPAPESLYDDVYVLEPEVHGTYSVRTTDPEAHPPAHSTPDGSDEIPQQMTDALLLGEDASMRGGEAS
jgi:pyruvate dehydrogenase E1 component alpha subunit